jgi:hypothetical protein
LAGDKRDRILNKQRLMLSAAMAALLAGAAAQGARADTDVTADTKSAVTTATDGNITIETTGQIEIKATAPTVTINSNNSLANSGLISNTDTSTSTGILVDTSAGDLVSSAGIYNIGAINLLGTGAVKAALAVTGGNTYYAPITFSEIISTTTVGTSSTTTATQISSVQVQGDNSFAIYVNQGTTIDGTLNLGGTVAMSPSKNSSAAGATLIELDGNLQGDFVLDNTTHAENVGLQARGIVILGPMSPCVDNPGLSYTCASASTAVIGGTTLGNTGAFVNGGSITVVGTSLPSTKGGNPEGGSAVVIGNSIAGGFLNNGPATANGSTISGTIIANGATVGGVAYPAILIDPSQTITATNAAIRGPIVLGVISSSIDAADGVASPTASTPGFGFINRGSIGVQAEDTDVNTTGMIITGASPLDTTLIQGGLLNTGAISSSANTSVNTNSATTTDTVTIGNYTTIPRIVLSGEETSSVTNTPGTISATVSGPGGGSATALGLLDLATVPEIDVLQHGSISAQISTSTVAPGADVATARTPFVQTAIAIIDASGTVKTINNAGTIQALTTVLNPAPNAVVSSSAHAIDLLAGTSGASIINNSGTISGDVYFNAGGNNNTLNVGNTGVGAGDKTGNADVAITAVQGAAVTNTPFNYAVVSELILSNSAGFAPTTDPNILSFGSGNGNLLHVGGYGYVNSVILSAVGGLDVQVDNNAQLFIANTQQTGSANVNNFTVNGGTLGLTITQESASGTPVVLAMGPTVISAAANIGLQFGSFITSPDSAHPTAQAITLISGPSVSDAGINAQNNALAQNIPFLFESPGESSAVPTPLSLGTAGGNQTLTITLLPRSTGATNADGTAGLNLSGAALGLFPKTAAALATDPDLGTAIASSLTVYNNSNGASSGINIAASQLKAQQIFSQFAPDVSGGSRQVAIMITDQATGPVAARQRLLRSYGNTDGEMTLWGQEFAGMINNKGRFDAEGDLTTYKDHGFGFSLGMDAGSARNGWYGGALTFYSSDVIETLPRQSDTNLEWYLLTGYTDWRANHVFLDTKLDIGYGNLDGKRILVIGDQGRVAEGKRAGLLGALGGSTGLFLNYGGFSIMPQISLDVMSMREEGYTETGGGDGFDLQVAPYYANSARTFLGVDTKRSFDVFGATISPEARLGYRYDFITAPVKLKAAFASAGSGTLTGLNSPGASFNFIGPDPDTGNLLAGFSLGAGTDTWHLGVNYDWIRGSNASTTQVGTLTLLGRI